MLDNERGHRNTIRYLFIDIFHEDALLAATVGPVGRGMTCHMTHSCRDTYLSKWCLNPRRGYSYR